MQIKIVTPLVLLTIFLCLISCGGSKQSEIAIPAAGQEISGGSETTTPVETSPSQVGTNEGIPEVPESPPSANPGLEEGTSTSLSSTTNLPSTENQREWPEDIGSNHIGALGNSLDGVEGAWIRPLPGRFIWGLMEPEKGKYLWIRNNGSTSISQLVDTFIVNSILFYWGFGWEFWQGISVMLTIYCYKLILAILDTPLIYLSVAIIKKKFNLTDVSMENS